MPVYFVHRCPYEGMTQKFIRTFDDETVLAWFRRHWQPLTGHEAYDRADEVLGTQVFSFGGFFEGIAEEALTPPQTIGQVVQALSHAFYLQIRYEEHCIQVYTSDDDVDMAYYFLDGVFLRRHGDLALYLLREDWRLPDGAGPGGWECATPIEEYTPWTGAGRLYLTTDGGVESDRGRAPGHASSIEGLRVPELCPYLAQSQNGHTPTATLFDNLWRIQEMLLRPDLVESAQEQLFLKAVRDDPADTTVWPVYSDWLEERGLKRATPRLLEVILPRLKARPYSDPSQNRVHVGEHIIQMYLHAGADLFQGTLLFDDVWGGAHPALAEAILRYAARWDVLSTGNEEVLG